MKALEIYKIWVENNYFDETTHSELKAIKDNEKEIEERFYRDLEFGTGGLRGIIGAGTNRINIYTIRKASQGLASYVLKRGEKFAERGIAIAYDSRNKSPEFAMEAAKVFCQNGIKTYLFDELRPTPELSFAVRHLDAAAGIVITASHNPKEYNGYKVYGEDGGQLSLEYSNAVLEEIDAISDITTIKVMNEIDAKEKGLLVMIGEEIDDIYMENLKTVTINKDAAKKAGDKFKIVYTPIHGSGNKPVRRILKETGFENVLVVKEQEQPDPAFSTVKYPNPEERNVFELAIKLAKSEDVDLIIGTDPDCDRVGVMVRKSDGEYTVLSGNQTGCLLLEYILSQKKERGELPQNGFAVKTIVTTELSRAICSHYGVELMEVLTGFKFIGEQIKLLDEEGDMKYLFGFEESYGYLAGTFVRDKDGVVASMLIAEMAAYYSARGMTLYDGLLEIFKNYGCYVEGITSFTLAGKEGIEKIGAAMKTLRDGAQMKFGSSEAVALRDYLKSTRIDENKAIEKLDLPQSDVLYYEMPNNAWFCIRPSGTEPKLKVYYGVKSENVVSADLLLEVFKNDIISVIHPLLS